MPRYRLAAYLFHLALANLAASWNLAVADDLAAYRVTDANASFFSLESRYNQSPSDGQTEAHCPRHALSRPIDYYVTMPAFYEDRDGWRKASKPFFAFEAQATSFAANYVRSGKPAYARCLVALLSAWADRRALLAYDYDGNHGQAWYAIEWTTATAGLAYSVVRAEPSLRNADRRKIEAWLSSVVTKHISFPGNRTSCCNNHLYWRGLGAAIIGVVTGDDDLFHFGIAAFRSAIQSMNPDGSLPLEVARGGRALHYQNFAILPLIFIAEVAARQGYDLYSLEIEGRQIHLAVDFLLSAMDSPTTLHRYTKTKQDMSFIDRGEELNWLEPYHRRFPGQKTGSLLNRLRPLSHTWSGGPSTLYFAEPDNHGAPIPGEALLNRRPKQLASE